MMKCFIGNCNHVTDEDLRITAVCVHEHIESELFCPCHYMEWKDELASEDMFCFKCKISSIPHECVMTDITDKVASNESWHNSSHP